MVLLNFLDYIKLIIDFKLKYFIFTKQNGILLGKKSLEVSHKWFFLATDMWISLH